MHLRPFVSTAAEYVPTPVLYSSLQIQPQDKPDDLPLTVMDTSKAGGASAPATPHTA